MPKPMTQFKKQLMHLVSLYADPGFTLYAKRRAQDLEACSSRQWTGIVEGMKAEIARQEAVASIGPKNIKGEPT